MEGEGGGEEEEEREGRGKEEEREGVRSGRQVVKMEGLGTVYKSRSDTVDRLVILRVQIFVKQAKMQVGFNFRKWLLTHEKYIPRENYQAYGTISTSTYVRYSPHS